MVAVLKFPERSPVVLPGTVQHLGHRTDVGKRVYVLHELEPHTDQALLNYCEYTPYFGGEVKRIEDRTEVTVYTD